MRNYELCGTGMQSHANRKDIVELNDIQLCNVDVAVVFEATRYIIKLYYHRKQQRKYTVRDSIKEVV